MKTVYIPAGVTLGINPFDVPENVRLVAVDSSHSSRTVGTSRSKIEVRPWMAKRINVRGHKYGAKPTVVDGIRFPSLKESRRYQELRLLEKAGEIWDLELQPRFPLCVPSTTGTARGAAKALVGTFDGRIGEYRADFAYHDRTGRVVEDSKGYDVPLQKWKRRHAETQYGLTVRIV